MTSYFDDLVATIAIANRRKLPSSSPCVVEDNHNDTSIVNQRQPEITMVPKIKKGVPVPVMDVDENGDDELTDLDISSLSALVKAQGEEIAGLKETVKQLTFKVDKQSQLIEGIKFLRKENEENESNVENPGPSPSTSGSGLGSGGRRRGVRPHVPSEAPRKRERPPKEYLNPVKMAKVDDGHPSQKSDDGEGIGSTSEDHEEQEVPCTSAVIPCGPSSSSGISEHGASEDGDIERERHMCDQCGKTYKTKGVLRVHIRSVHENIRFNCPHCPGTFAQLVHLEGHMKLHVEGGPPLEKCKVCGIELNGKRGLMIHMGAVHKIYAGIPIPAAASKEVSKISGGGSAVVNLREYLSTNQGISGMEPETSLGKGEVVAVDEVVKVLNEEEKWRRRR